VIGFIEKIRSEPNESPPPQPEYLGVLAEGSPWFGGVDEMAIIYRAWSNAPQSPSRESFLRIIQIISQHISIPAPPDSAHSQ
jgi:hypothetical protein